MTILCAGDTHVFQLGSTACDCGLWGAAAQPANPSINPSINPSMNPSTSSGRGSGHGPYPLYYPHGYNPFSPPKPPPPPVAGEAPPLHVFEAAQRAGASHLSADGLRVYTVRYGETLEAEWKAEGRIFGAWSVVAEMPADAVAM